MLQFLVESPWEKKLYRVDGDEIVVGRSRAAAIPLLDEGVRKRAFLILRSGSEIRYRALAGSALSRNDRPAGDEGPLRVGDRLRAASTTITLQAILPRRAAPAPPASPPAAAAAPPPAASTSGPIEASRSVRLDPAADESFLAGGLRSVLEINKRLVRERDEAKLFALILDAAVDLSGAERGFLLLVGDGGVTVRASRTDEGAAVASPGGAVSRSVALRAARERRAVLAADAGEDERWAGTESVAALSLKSVLAVPLIAEEEVRGVLYVDHLHREAAFTAGHVRLLEAFADQAALALRAFALEAGLRARTAELSRRNEEVERLNARLSGELTRAREDLQRRQDELEFRYDYRQIVGRSRGIRQVLTTLDKVTDVNVPVFIEGESGTGKELVARALHFNGPRKKGPFVTENCSAIPDSLVEKILFGHVRGAFTGADADAPGLFEQANGGTLFLDEIGDMSPEAQKKILRVLQEGEVRRVGGRDVRPVDVRIVCATNRDVDQMVKTGEFREDLYWRLVVVRIRMPPLRERPEDVPLLAEHFLREWAQEVGVPAKPVEAAAMDLLVRYPWPGNVRELANEMRRLVALAGDRITPEVLSARIREAPPAPPPDFSAGRTLKDLVEEVERRRIVEELAHHHGNKTRAAESLGLSRLGLRNKIQRYGLADD